MHTTKTAQKQLKNVANTCTSCTRPARAQPETTNPKPPFKTTPQRAPPEHPRPLKSTPSAPQDHPNAPQSAHQMKPKLDASALEVYTPVRKQKKKK